MKVLFVSTFGERLGGSEEFLWTFLRHVDRARIEPVVVFNSAGAFEREVAGLGIPTEVIDHGRFRQLGRGARAVLALRRTLRRERPELIVSWFTRAHLYAAPAALLAGMGDRLVWFQHTLPVGTTLDRPATLLPAKAIGANSEACARAQQRIRPRRPTFVVHPGIDRPAPASPQELAELEEQLAIPSGRSVVGIVGRLEPWKGQHLVIDVVAELRRAGRDAHALLVGGDAYAVAPGYDASLRRQAAERGLADAVTFTGQVDDAKQYIQLMDVSVNASRHEPFGIVLLEAMALGVPVVAFDADGGPQEILDHGRAGLLARPGDALDLAEKVALLIDDEGRRRRLIEDARARFESAFSAERMTAALGDRFIALAAGGR